MFNLSFAEQIGENSNRFHFLYHITNDSFEYLSPHYEKIWGTKITSNLDLIQNIKKEDRAFVSEMFLQFKEEAFNDSVEFALTFPDKQIFLSCDIMSFNDDSGKVAWIAGYVHDITKKRAYDMNNYDYMAKKNALLEILEHELGGHLSLIKSIASAFTQKNVQHNLRKLNSYAQSIQELSKTAMNLISDLVKKELISTLKSPIKKVRVNVVESIRSMFAIFSASEDLISKQFQLLASKDEIFLEVDHIKFMQVMNNLVYNAIKFTKDDGKITIQIADQETSVVFSITDNGIGIPKNLQSNLFDEHTPAAREGLRGEKTNGIGLSIVKKFIEMHEGKIWVTSTEGVGSSFYIEIPKR